MRETLTKVLKWLFAACEAEMTQVWLCRDHLRHGGSPKIDKGSFRVQLWFLLHFDV